MRELGLDDEALAWARHGTAETRALRAVDAALGRRGTGKLDDRGLGTVAPSWNDVLYGPEPVEDPGPPDLTYVKGGDSA
jgi:hypothetical protein